MASSNLSPILYVDDIDQALRFYRDGLGFTELWTAAGPDGGAPIIAAVQVEDASLMVSQMPMFAPANGGPRGDGVTMWFNLAEPVDDYFARFRDVSGATVTQEPIDYPWGDRAFTLRDPFGYTLTFANFTQPDDGATGEGWQG